VRAGRNKMDRMQNEVGEVGEEVMQKVLMITSWEKG
jgi:hypothetical protein